MSVELVAEAPVAGKAAGSVTCTCGYRLFDGEVIRSRVVKPSEGLAKCRCKRWVRVPVCLSGGAASVIRDARAD